MAELFPTSGTLEQKQQFFEDVIKNIPLASEVEQGQLAIEGSRVQELQSALDAGDIAQFEKLFGKTAENFSGALDVPTQRLENLQLGLANITDFSAFTPEEAALKRQELAPQIAELEAQIAQEQAQLQQFGDIFGIDVPDFTSSFTRVDSGFIPSDEVTPTMAATVEGAEPQMQEIDFIEGLSAEQINSITNLVDTGREFNETDAKNFAFATGTEDWQQFVGMTGQDILGTTVETEQGESLLQRVNETDGSLSANLDFINGAFQAYLGRDATQAELDRFEGETVEAVRNALKTGAGAGSEADVSIDDDSIAEADSDFVEEALNDPVTRSEITSLLSQIQEQQQEYLATLQPSEEEVDLQEQLIELRTSYELGLAEIEDQPIAMDFITGQQASLERRATALESNLLQRLGLAQQERAIEAQIAETQLGFFQTNVNLALQAQQIIMQQEEILFNRSMTLRADARDNLITVLDTLQGIDPNELTDTQRSQLQQLATDSGLPFDLVVSGLENVKNQLDLEQSTARELLDTTITLDDGSVVLLNSYGQEIGRIGGNYSVGTTADTVSWDNWLTSTGGTISQGFDNEVGYIAGRTVHGGIDIAMQEGTPLAAPVSGTITFAGEQGGWGNTVVIEDGSGNSWRLAHMNDLSVSSGQQVGAGAFIGTSGNTGFSTGPHVHIEIKDRNGNLLEPQSLMTGISSDFEPEFQEAIRLATSNLLTRLDVEETANISTAMETGSIQNVREAMLSTASASLDSSLFGDVVERQSTIDALDRLESSMIAYIESGGEVGLLSGKIENIDQRVRNSTDDPVLAQLAAEMKFSFFEYRNAMTGAAFTPEESATYEQIMPSSTKSPELNIAVITAVRNQMSSKQRSAMGTVIGQSNYDTIFGSGVDDAINSVLYEGVTVNDGIQLGDIDDMIIKYLKKYYNFMLPGKPF